MVCEAGDVHCRGMRLVEFISGVAPVNEVRSGELRDEALPTSSQRNAPLCLSRLAEMGLLPALELNEQVNQIRIIIIIV